jgi:hypothetical protein
VISFGTWQGNLIVGIMLASLTLFALIADVFLMQLTSNHASQLYHFEGFI